MKIQNISNVKINQLTNKLKNANSFAGIQTQTKELTNIPTKNYLAFLGGYSLSLEETANNLNSSQYPAGIEEVVREVLNNGNTDKKTLFDVHFEKYKGVLDCYSLDELKEKYPEFKDVKSVYEVSAKSGSIISRFQEGDSKVFESDEDLTLQLIKLYWGKGFSLTDISKYIETNDPEESKNLYYALTQKLNIPLMDRTYAHVLKLSNKEYNEKFTSELAQKLKDARDEKEQKSKGEAVFIPRRPLSETHKKHISDSLIKYYEEHPQKVYELSERQKEYFEEHPEQKEIMSEALDYAWNKTHDGQTVKKAIVKFARKSHNLSNEDLILKNDLDPQKRNLLKEFWTKNIWARGKFSSALKDGWEYAKFDVFEYMANVENDENVMNFKIIPSRVSSELYNYILSQGKEIPRQCIGSITAFSKPMSKIEKEKFDKYSKEAAICLHQYGIDHPKIATNVATAKQIALLKVENELEDKSSELPPTLQDGLLRNLLLTQFKIIQKEINYCQPSSNGKYKYPVSGVNNDTLTAAICRINSFAHKIFCDEFIEYLTKVMDETYDKLDKGDYSSLL